MVFDNCNTGFQWCCCKYRGVWGCGTCWFSGSVQRWMRLMYRASPRRVTLLSSLDTSMFGGWKIGGDYFWLVVSNMFTVHFIYGMSSFPLTNSYFSRWLKPPTSIWIADHHQLKDSLISFISQIWMKGSFNHSLATEPIQWWFVNLDLLIFTYHHRLWIIQALWWYQTILFESGTVVLNKKLYYPLAWCFCSILQWMMHNLFQAPAALLSKY